MTSGGERVALTPTGMSYRGTAVARLAGQAVFVEGALPGESLIAEVSRRHKNFLEARVVDVVEASPHRVQPRCSHFAEAGSCEWEFIDYPEQLRLKTEILRDQLRRVGKFGEAPLLDAVPSPSPWSYRNHVRFAIDSAGNPAYLRRASHDTVAIDHCAVLLPEIETLLPRLQGKLGGIQSLTIRHGRNTDETLIAPAIGDRVPELESGQDSYHEEILGRRFQISAASFFQVNTEVAEAMVRLVQEGLRLGGAERLADLYAGVGLFACLLSSSSGSVLAIESEAGAVEDGRLNSGFLENVRWRKGRAEDVLPRIQPGPDAVVLDPPRAGCDAGVIKALIESRAQKIAYCSCDAATLARDLRLLVDGGFRLTGVRVVDMFPQTYHIESISLLER
jgi:23S rRNA (uracil1939-C5)-methyltransferase